MEAIYLVVYLFAVAFSCMSLALGIASKINHRAEWNVVYIVFQSCLVATMVMGFCYRMAASLFSHNLYMVFSYILPIMMSATMGFSTVILPYFCSFLISRRWGKRQRIFFYPFGIIYFVAGLVGTIIKYREFTNIIQTVFFLMVFVYSIVMMWRNLLTIDDIYSRNICLVINIVSMILIPTSIVILFFPAFKGIAYPIYVLAFSIIMLIYFFTRFKVDSRNQADSLELTSEGLEKYHITDRELEVIKLVCQGKSNKEIALAMTISVNTVNNHIANIFEKMDISSRMDLMRIMKTGPWA